MTWRTGRAHRVTQPTITNPPPPSWAQKERTMDYPMTPMQMASAGYREIFESLVNSGFTEKQALYLLGVTIATLTSPEIAE